MPSKTPDYMIQLQAEGNAAERRTEKAEVYRKAQELKEKMPAPPNQYNYLAEKLKLALTGQLDPEAFKEFIRITNTYMELAKVEARVRMLIKKGVK